MKTSKLNLAVILPVLILNLLVLNCYSQDSLKFKDNRLVLAKVYEVTPEMVKYKKINDMDGPLFQNRKEVITLIKYNNGYIETFNEKLNHNKIIQIDHKYYWSNTKSIKSKNILTKLDKVEDKQIRIYVSNAQVCNKIGKYVGISAAAFALSGMALLVANNALGIPLIGMASGGISAFILIESDASNNTRKAIKMYNEKY